MADAVVEDKRYSTLEAVVSLNVIFEYMDILNYYITRRGIPYLFVYVVENFHLLY